MRVHGIFLLGLNPMHTFFIEESSQHILCPTAVLSFERCTLGADQNIQNQPTH